MKIGLKGFSFSFAHLCFPIFVCRWRLSTCPVLQFTISTWGWPALEWIQAISQSLSLILKPRFSWNPKNQSIRSIWPTCFSRTNNGRMPNIITARVCSMASIWISCFPQKTTFFSRIDSIWSGFFPPGLCGFFLKQMWTSNFRCLFLSNSIILSVSLCPKKIPIR